MNSAAIFSALLVSAAVLLGVSFTGSRRENSAPLPSPFTPHFPAPGTDMAGWIPHEKSAAYLDRVRDAESRYGIPHNLLARLIQQESFWNPRAYNASSDAQGLAQIVPRWHPNVSNPFDATEAIDYAGKYLRELFDNFGTWSRALAAYNWGWGNIDTWISQGERFAALPRETQNYVTEITGDVPA